MSALSVNRKASFEYEILQTLEAGVVLAGFEVKSVREGRANLLGAFVIVRGGEAYLVNASIPPYQTKNTPTTYEPTRARKLLLRHAEIQELIGKAQQKGLTLIPLSMYTKGPRIKLEFALARRKKNYDKRETIRERDEARRFQRGLE